VLPKGRVVLELTASAQRIQEVLERQGVACRVAEMPATTRTAEDAARAIGCSVGQIAKSLVFKAQHTGRPILVIASGTNRVNEKAIGALVGETLEKANADFVRAKTGFAIGGVPPIGHAEQPITFLDEDLLKHEEIWAAAGTPHAVFRLTPADLRRITGGQVISVK
jgi:prolyl-tRNA editing enzyme YbaK/EbsC (Cys-tRNA(Pro) deacylase)